MSSKEQIKKRKDKKQKSMSLNRAYAVCFGTEEGAIVLKDLREKSCYDKEFLCLDAQLRVDPERQRLMTGMRNLFVHIRTKIKGE